MKVTFVSDGTLNEVWQNKLDQLGRSQLVVFGFNGLGLVSYKKELSGETEYFSDLAKMSKHLSSVVICGCDTDTYGVFRHSAVIADNGKILGVSDMAHTLDNSEFVPGGNFRVYETSVGKLGIIICEDLFFPDSAKILTLCDADFIVCLFKKIEDSMPIIMLRALSFANGVPMLICANGYSAVADVKGNVLVGSSSNIVKIQVKDDKNYRLISCRRRGIYKDGNSNYKNK